MDDRILSKGNCSTHFKKYFIKLESEISENDNEISKKILSNRLALQKFCLGENVVSQTKIIMII